MSGVDCSSQCAECAGAAARGARPHAIQLAFRTLFWNSEAILPEFLKRGEAELATDAFIPHNHLFLYALPLNNNFLQLGRLIAAPLG